MPQRRKRWRLPLGIVFSAIVGASLATLAAVAPQLTMQHGRRTLAVDMQEEFQKHGLHYAVATAGEEDTILQIKAPSMTKPFAEYLVRDPAKGERLGKLGFASVVFANGKGGTWTYDITERRIR